MTRGPASRNERFVRVAKRLLTVQLAAAAAAAAVTGWAVLEVRDLVNERDRLAARLAQVEPPPPGAEPQPAGPSAEPAAVTPPESNATEATAVESGNDQDDSPPPDGNSIDDGRPPDRVACTLVSGGLGECRLPLVRHGPICLTIEGRPAHCPDGTPPPPPPSAECRIPGIPRIEMTACTPPFRRFPGTEFCLDANRVRVYCPPGVPGAPTGGDTRDPPPPARDCRSVEGRAIVCAPPYRTTPVPGVCVDRNNRPLRCPRGVVPREPRPATTGTRPTRPTVTRTPTQPSATTRPSPSPSPTAPTRTTRPTTTSRQPTTTTRQPTTSAPSTRQPAATTTAPQRTTRPVTTAPTPVRRAPVRRTVPPPPESNQAQPQ